MLDVNLKGPFLCMKHGIPAIARSGGGTVVLLGSVLGVIGSPGYAAYCASKGALDNLAKQAAIEHAADGVRVNVVSPSATDTGSVRARCAEHRATRKRCMAHGRRAAHRWRRLGRAEEVRPPSRSCAPPPPRSSAVPSSRSTAPWPPAAREVSTLRVAGRNDGRSGVFTHHMSDEDALMWNIEKDPILRSTILAVAVFDRPPDWRSPAARASTARRASSRGCASACVSPPLRIGPPRWMAESDVRPRLPPAAHCGSPAPGTTRALLDALQPIATAGFDRARPLWEFTLFEGLEADGGRAAFAMKVHHSVTDGVGGMALLTDLVDLVREPEPDPRKISPPCPRPSRSARSALVRDSLTHTSRRMLGITRRIPGRVTSRDGRGAARSRRRRGNVGATRRVPSAALLAPATAPMSPVMRDRGLGRRLAC